MPEILYQAVDDNAPFVESYQFNSKPVFYDFDSESSCDNTFDSDFSSSDETSNYNPYEGVAEAGELDCQYVISTPDVLSKKSIYNIPPPFEEAKEMFTYTLEDGSKLIMENPLPNFLPMEVLIDVVSKASSSSDDLESSENDDEIEVQLN
ncbi:hypothetical protein TVAG_425970 [Trichomonas vaginalis G3]|uniref:Uncharacterized protein n=1 Tax=Trichomonas vaginalis (strain ATCC PRA-98 / G3) TaxID=412133 RepID=A2FGY5_TRIV3|nr:hypothetical protein TVAGG3_1056150 [Trichomonas vaginalis G3]EAX95844.1 hypothetical protein TVAG_425970 [Trichomonas vaginalis G3]KAI5494459.1 hypothetical protein TVAGG3_1056150 [Trichomonas vaginalis G3]|eukprot:XP_001308774.1 hypothetical protein [Trichomonas vaginalis G3]